MTAAAKRPLSERKKKRYISILNVALDLMERNGFDGVSVRELAELAEITPTTIYNVFGSKEGLLSAAIEFRTRLFIRNAINEGKRGFEGLIAVNRQMAETSIQSNQLIRSIAAMLARDSTLFAVRQIYRTFHCNLIKDIQLEGDLAQDAKPEALASFLMIAHNAALNFWAGNDVSTEQLSALFDIETCNVLYPVARGSTTQLIDRCYEDRLVKLGDIDFDGFLRQTHKLPGQFDISALTENI
ncbi:TetR/AcrR family transcriptional regulator [Rhizorhabdus argentea]|uniref:TetR/AcrR family transcriptional regulator n=1 Tax=Rhizorhabdus argentea TaxID=1387174 RepID=UPI0030EB7300